MWQAAHLAGLILKIASSDHTHNECEATLTAALAGQLGLAVQWTAQTVLVGWSQLKYVALKKVV